MNGRRVTDEQIEAALAETDITPDLCEWYDGAYGSVIFRIELYQGRYAEGRIDPWHDRDGIVYVIQRVGRELENQRA